MEEMKKITGLMPQEEESNVSPEEQKAYDDFVTNGMQLMYSEKSMPQILKAISGDGNPVEGLANALVMIVMRLEDSAKQKGVQVDGDIKLQGGTELLEQMAELAEAAGIHTYSQQEIDGALFQALDLYSTARKDQLPVDELKQDFAMMQQADQQGRLDEVVPGASQFASMMGA